jgi:integrase
MSVTLRKRGSKWYVFVNYHGRRKNKCVGTRAAAEEVRRQLEAKLALGDLGFFAEGEGPAPNFSDYAQQWLSGYAESECKPSTVRSYEQLLRIHVIPRFGERRLTEIEREQIKAFIADLSQCARFARNTLRLIVCALRTVLNAAVEDGIIESNPASKVGRFAKSEKPARQASAMSGAEAESFLAAVHDVCPEWHPFFLMALRSGLRKGELIALQWGDIQFGTSADDPNRYMLVQRNWSCGRFTSPKSKKSRRVDLSRQLRACLLELRDTRLLTAMMAGKTGITDDLVFPSQAGTVISPDNIVVRYMEPALERAGLRRFRFHDLRHTFGSLLIQGGASLPYVKDQMGHSSIQITVDTYGHLIAGADIAWMDQLDSKTTTYQSAPGTHQPAPGIQQALGVLTRKPAPVAERIWLPPRDSNPDMLIQSQLSCR